ncbi:hypothetical protein RHGRI_014268 [Rhododendron griersonianum]|uniref:Uncharacterized protein n=1 Tax=Rhododendron griersonianum TaxID=479676 RepID=A0AAV6K947_9ERIC|nr:hypothetical protein RHGRI_014268 [Rhododendron griersonianum]
MNQILESDSKIALIRSKIHKFSRAKVKCWVCEIDERDRGSLAYLQLSQKPVNSLNDLLRFTNKAKLSISILWAPPPSRQLATEKNREQPVVNENGEVEGEVGRGVRE